MNKIRWILACVLFLIAPAAYAADGDITAVRINASGWYAEVDIAGLAVGGTYDLGIGTNNDPAAAKMVFTVTSKGYADDGTLGTMTRTVIGTNYKRKAYPNEAVADEVAADGTLTVTVALSDWIYTDDTMTVSIGAGFYTEAAGDGGTANAASAATYAVTNNSAEPYSAAKVVGNWSWPGWSRVTGPTLTLRAVAYHRSAQQKRPVRSVFFTCTDQHAHSASATVTTPTIDNSMGDAVPVIEYIGNISTASFTQGDTLTCNFVAYPWYGDAGSILNTGDGVNTMPTPLYAPQYHLVDTAGTYGVTVACVDAALDDDTGGVAVDVAAFNPASTGCYKTIAAAATAIAAYNNTNHGRNNTGGAIIYLKEGSHVWTGGTVSAGGQATAQTWTTVTKFPGTARANVLIASAATTKQVGERLKVEDVTVTNSTVAGFTGMDYFWLHNSVLSPTGAATIYINTCVYITASSIANVAELLQYSTSNAARALIRGNATSASHQYAMRAYTVLGNSMTFTGGGGISADGAGQTVPAFDNMIYAHNKFYSVASTDTTILLKATYDLLHGMAFVGNLVERSGAATTPLIRVSGDASANPAHNVLFWHNTIVGQRANLAYNDYNLNNVTPPVYRKHWSIVGNIFDDYNCVTDKDTHGGTADDDRIGNHSVIHGVGQWGNIITNRVGTDSYENKFGGLYYKRGAPLAPNFLNDQSNSVSGAGGGTYTIHSNSPAHNLSIGDAVLPYGLEGNRRRTEADDAGAFVRGVGKVL